MLISWRIIRNPSEKARFGANRSKIGSKIGHLRHFFFARCARDKRTCNLGELANKNARATGGGYALTPHNSTSGGIDRDTREERRDWMGTDGDHATPHLPLREHSWDFCLCVLSTSGCTGRDDVPDARFRNSSGCSLPHAPHPYNRVKNDKN